MMGITLFLTQTSPQSNNFQLYFSQVYRIIIAIDTPAKKDAFAWT